MTHFSSSGIAYKVLGSGTRPLLFIHGFIFDSSLWDRQVPALAEDHKLVIPDLRGFGESDDCDGMITLESYVDDILDLIKELKLGKPLVAGLSMGGYVALRLAEREPGLFSGLVLFDTRATGDTNEAKIKRAAGIRVIKAGGLRMYTGALMESVFSEKFKKNEPEEFRGFIDRGSSIKPEGAVGALLAMMGRTDTSGFLESTELPVLAVCGEFDTLTPPAEMAAMMKNVRNGELHIIPGAGHAAPFEEPEACNKILKDFLSRVN